MLYYFQLTTIVKVRHVKMEAHAQILLVAFLAHAYEDLTEVSVRTISMIVLTTLVITTQHARTEMIHIVVFVRQVTLDNTAKAILVCILCFPSLLPLIFSITKQVVRDMDYIN